MEKESTICYIMTTFVIIFILINLGQSKWSDIDAVRADAASANPKYNNSELSDSINKNYNFEKKLVYNNTDQEVPLELTMSVYNIKILDQIVPINIFSQEDDLINNIILDKDTKSITLILNPRLMPGKLFIEIPRSILDSQSKNSDINFTAFLNDRPVEIKELVETNDSKVLLNTYNKYSKESDNRKLMIEFDKNTKVIKIHGTDIQTTNKSLSETEGNNTIKKDANENVDLLVPLFSTLFGISIAIFYLLYRKRNIKRKFN